MKPFKSSMSKIMLPGPNVSGTMPADTDMVCFMHTNIVEGCLLVSGAGNIKVNNDSISMTACSLQKYVKIIDHSLTQD